MSTLTCNLLQCTLINTLWPLEGSIVHQCTSNHKIQPLMAPTCMNASRHSKCTQPTQIKCSINQMCRNKFQWLKSRLTMLECALIHIQCFQIPPKNTNQTLVHLQTPNGLQNLKAPPKFFKPPPRLPKAPPKPSKSANLHLQHTQTLKISLNAHKQSNL